MLQQLELASKLESEPKSRLYVLVLEELNLFHLIDRSNNCSSIDEKMDWSVFDETLSFKMLGLSSSCKLDWGSYIISIVKTAAKKIGAMIHSMKFMALYCCLTWNTWMSGLVLLVATGICWIICTKLGSSWKCSNRKFFLYVLLW